MRFLRSLALAALAAAALATPADAQAIGGNFSISATTTSANVQLTGAPSSYPFVMLQYGVGASTNEIFYKFGVDNTVTATNTSPALPANGVCLNIGPNTWVAALAGTATGTLRITQLSVCPSK